MHSLALHAHGQTRSNRVRLRTHSGAGEIILWFAHKYTVAFQPDVIRRSPFEVRTSYYLYRILDRDEREIVVYHWEPDGPSSFVVPHLHVSAASPVILPQPEGSRLAGSKTFLNKLHLPTGRIGAEEVIELLVADFSVDPLIPSWKEVLSESRAAADRH